MKLSQVNPELRRTFWTMPTTPVSNPLVLRLIRLLMPLIPDARTPEGMMLEKTRAPPALRGSSPLRAAAPAPRCCGSTVAAS